MILSTRPPFGELMRDHLKGGEYFFLEDEYLSHSSRMRLFEFLKLTEREGGLLLGDRRTVRTGVVFRRPDRSEEYGHFEFLQLQERLKSLFREFSLERYRFVPCYDIESGSRFPCEIDDSLVRIGFSGRPCLIVMISLHDLHLKRVPRLPDQFRCARTGRRARCRTGIRRAGHIV